MKKIIIMACLFLGSKTYGAIAFDAAASQATPGLSPVTWTHTCTGSNLILFVGVEVTAPFGATVSSVTYNGVAMVLISSASSNNNNVSNTGFWDATFYLTNPASGAHTVSLFFSGTSSQGAGGSISLTGVDQTTPLDASSCATGISGSPSVTLTTKALNDWVLDGVANFSGTFSGEGANQTARWNDALTSGSSGGPFPPRTPETYTWSGLNTGWADCASAFCPVGCLSGVPQKTLVNVGL